MTAALAAPSCTGWNASDVSVVHATPGRLRLKLEARSDADALLPAARSVIAALPGVRSVRVNPSARSIVVHHDTSVPGTRDARSAPHARPGARIAKAARALRRALVRALRRLAGTALERRTLVPLALGATAALIAGMHAGTPVWLTLTLVVLDALAVLYAARSDAGAAFAVTA